MTPVHASLATSSGTTLALRILRRAEELGMTKKQLAQRANISRQTLDNLLQAPAGESRLVPSIQTLMSLSVALRLHPFWLTDAIFEEVRMAKRTKQLVQGDRAGLVRDATCPDGCVVEPGASFRKVWTNQILSSHDYTGRKLVCWDDHVEVTVTRRDGSRYQAHRLLPKTREIFPDISAMHLGGVPDSAVDFVAPHEPGVAFSYWRLAEADGTLCFHESAAMWALVFVEPLAQRRRPFPGATLNTVEVREVAGS